MSGSSTPILFCTVFHEDLNLPNVRGAVPRLELLRHLSQVPEQDLERANTTLTSVLFGRREEIRLVADCVEVVRFQEQGQDVYFVQLMLDKKSERWLQIQWSKVQLAHPTLSSLSLNKRLHVLLTKCKRSCTAKAIAASWEEARPEHILLLGPPFLDI